ncbi:kinase-like protein [Martensiomyces pterosporus]|nr:kinase-like protein [Martensiomyces pterosporus]
MMKSALRKKRNFKNLALAVADTPAPSNVSGLGGPVSTPDDGAEAGNILAGAGGPESIYPLEIGVEFRLDLREEDLVQVKSMGEGAGGAVMKVMHKPTQTVMAMKVERMPSTCLCACCVLPVDMCSSRMSALRCVAMFCFILLLADTCTTAYLLRLAHSQLACLPAPSLFPIRKCVADANIRQQVLKELQILHECNSPYIVSFYGAFPKNNGIQMCLEFMDLGSFDNIYRKHGPIPINVIGRITTSVLQGLIYLYEDMRVMHRDIKPSNILLNSSGFIKICDFGISKEMINSIADTFVGTASYMSPERMKGSSYTVKSDVWSLGLTLMELALGKFPFRPEGEAMSIFEMLNYITTEDLPSLSPEEFPKDFCDMIDSCLAKDPMGRPTPRELVSHPFVVACANAKVDIAKWAKSLQTEE